MRDFVNLGDLRDPATPETNTALIDCRDWDKPRILSHGDVDRQANACARALVTHGLARGDRVAILSLNRAELLIAYLAIMRAGFVAVPANLKFPRETIGFILDDAQVKLTFCDASGRVLLPASMGVIDFDASGSDGFAMSVGEGTRRTNFRISSSSIRRLAELTSIFRRSATRR